MLFLFLCTSFQKNVYFATLLCTAVASTFLIAPSVHHRLLFRQHAKEELVVTANRLALVGLTFLAPAIIGVLLLVTDFLFGTVEAILVTGLAAGLMLVIWFVMPLRLRG